MTIVFDRPYEFVPPDRSNIGPWVIQRLRLVDRYLARKEGVLAHECRHWQKLKASTDAGHGVMLAPNHSRYADPLAMGWPGRYASVNFFAVASWHLFNKGWFDSFAMRKCGGFSLHREGMDRKSLETSIECMAQAQRALILFPEGQTFRTNDIVRDLLDGATFIARSAARRRAKQHGGKVVVHPVGIKYYCMENIESWAGEQLTQMERMFGWRRTQSGSLSQRLTRVSESILRLQEIQYLGDVQSGANGSGGSPPSESTDERRVSLAKQVIRQVEERLELPVNDEDDIGTRSRPIRTKISSKYFELANDSPERVKLRDDDFMTDVAHWLNSYSDSYFAADVVTDSRIVETIQRFQEFLIGKANRKFPLKAVLEVGDPIEVPAKKAPRGEADPLSKEIHAGITEIVDRLVAQA